jgi:hypothetical protein
VKCLGVINRREAETLAHALAFEHERRIEALRTGLACNENLTLVGKSGCTLPLSQQPVELSRDLCLMRPVDLWAKISAPRSPTSLKSMKRVSGGLQHLSAIWVLGQSPDHMLLPFGTH